MTSIFDWRNNPSVITVEPPGHNTGRRASKESRRRNAEMLSSGTSSTIAQFDLDGRLLRKYPSIHAAARDMGVSCQAISRCVNGNGKTAAGLKWALCPRIGCE